MNTLNLRKINNTTALICTFILILTSASIISKIFWHFIDHEASLPIEKTLNRTSEIASELPLPYNLFGAQNAQEKPNHNKIENTPLNLILVGILSKQDSPSVIIIKEGGKEKIYQINDFITPNTILKEVFSQYIIIERNGALEKLEIKRNKMSTEKTLFSSNSKLEAPKKLILRGYLQDLKTNPEKLLDVLSVQPNMRNGQLRGFIIAPGSEKALFEELGFQINDIILNINNRELNNLSQAIKLREVLAEKTIFDIIIERKGQIKSLSINLN